MPNLTASKLEANNALAFVLAGKATFTLVSLKTETRYTYKVNQAKEQPGQAPRWFVKLLTGPLNTRDYTYLGQISMDGDTPYFNLTKASTMSEDSAPVVAFGWTFKNLKAHVESKNLEIWHEGRCCCCCGKPLTVPESIASGIGPVCAAKM